MVSNGDTTTNLDPISKKSRESERRRRRRKQKKNKASQASDAEAVDADESETATARDEDDAKENADPQQQVSFISPTFFYLSSKSLGI